jgi:hypothetical protein
MANTDPKYNRHQLRAMIKIARTGRLTKLGRNKAVQKLLGVDPLTARDLLARTPIIEHAKHYERAMRVANATAREEARARS